MNKSTTLRSEEARRQAQAASLQTKQQQMDALQERASFFASETRKVVDLRAQRLAKVASPKVAGEAVESAAPPRTVVKRRRVTPSSRSRSEAIEGRA